MTVYPVTDKDFALLMTAFGPFDPQPVLAAAVSGGGDSMALLLLAQRWAQDHGGRVVALTVDHGLRPESGAEAAQVGQWAKGLGVEHHILKWEGPKPEADIQAQARIARYDLMVGWCKDHGVSHLALAHHLEDQAETFLLRLARGSGVDGLSAMSPLAVRDGVRLMRPLLGAPKASLLKVLEERGQPWVEDPSNSDEHYARARMRKLVETLSAEGLTPKRLASTATAMARVRESLELETAKAIAAYVTFSPLGYCVLNRDGLAAAPPEIALRLLRDVAMGVGGQSVPPRLDRLERLLYALLDGPAAATISGCRVLKSGVICREARHLPLSTPIAPGQTIAWDGRFRIKLNADGPQGLSVAALGQDGWAQLRTAMGRDGAPKLIKAIRDTVPALWRDQRLCAAPLLGYNGDVAVTMTFMTRAMVHSSGHSLA